MDKLLESVDKQASLACSVFSLKDFNQNLLQQFLQKNPLWDFHGVSRGDYLHKSKAEKEQLVLSYYNSIINGDKFAFHLSFLRCFLNFLDCSIPNLSSKSKDVWYTVSIVPRIIFRIKVLTFCCSLDKLLIL